MDEKLKVLWRSRQEVDPTESSGSHLVGLSIIGDDHGDDSQEGRSFNCSADSARNDIVVSDFRGEGRDNRGTVNNRKEPPRQQQHSGGFISLFVAPAKAAASALMSQRWQRLRARVATEMSLPARPA